MSKKFIHGVNGHFAQTYSGGQFVAMGPCPAQGAVDVSEVYAPVSAGATFTYGDGWVRLTVTSLVGYPYAKATSGQIVRMFYVPASPNVTISLQSSVSRSSISGHVYIGDPGAGGDDPGIDFAVEGSSGSASFTMPYYRVRLEISYFLLRGAEDQELEIGDYVQVDFTPS